MELKIRYKNLIVIPVTYAVIATIVYFCAGIAYERELDLFEYYQELSSGDFFSPRWKLDIGFSSLLYFLSAVIWSPNILSVSAITIIYLISICAFRGQDRVFKAALFCLSYPVLLGSVNQLRATLFMAFLLLALNAGKNFRNIKIMIAGSMHIYSFIIFFPIAIRRLNLLWVVPPVIIFLFGSTYVELMMSVIDVLSSYEAVNLNTSSIVMKAFILIVFMYWINSRIDGFIILGIAAGLLFANINAVLDRFLTLAMMYVFFDFLNAISDCRSNIHKYIFFAAINSVILLNSSLLWPQ